jgi:hypothetical protein
MGGFAFIAAYHGFRYASPAAIITSPYGANGTVSGITHSTSTTASVGA